LLDHDSDVAGQVAQGSDIGVVHVRMREKQRVEPGQFSRT
jgi:hypothetical protein